MTWQDSSKKPKTCPLQRDEVFGCHIYEPGHLVHFVLLISWLIKPQRENITPATLKADGVHWSNQ
jgi:hypothetical protein